ncbi:MAG TPA: hypothetical protein PKD79_02185 [Candidatus Doudnabacteria bacterium]|nr:hypothetical protein [Candidatus Doudnabacteria bacterium]
MNTFLSRFASKKAFYLITAIFVIVVLWWITIFARGLTEGAENQYFTTAYSIIALLSGIAGLVYAQKWGGFHSTLGSAIAMFAFGLIAQFLGQIIYSYYIIVREIDVPYPSLGDISFFAAVLFNIYGSYLLAKVCGIRLSLKQFRGRALAIAIPALMLFVSYWLLLRGYEIDPSEYWLLFLDFGYPIGQAIFVSIALLTLFMSKDILGGMMRKSIILLLLALISQFVFDFSFSYQYTYGEVYAGDALDLFHSVSYYLMTIAIFSIGNMFYKVQDS